MSEPTGEAQVKTQSTLVPVGYIGGLILPIVGVVIAIVLFARGDRGPAGGILVTSIVAAAVWFSIFGS